MRASGAAWVLSGLILTGVPLAGQPLAPERLPAPLKPWTEWVLDGHEDRLCPVIDSEAACLWPGRLVLDASGSGARFQLEVYADRPIDMPLPGGAKAWPQSVVLDGRPVPVIEADDVPTVHLTAGRHTCAGSFVWSELPDAIAVPEAVALVDLRVGGRAVVPRRGEEGVLVLKQDDGPATGGENLQIKVFRRLEDGLPLWLDTRLLIEASGKAREVRLQGAVVADSVPVAVGGDLPARLDPGGVLRVQVRPGRFTVRVLLRLEGRPSRLSMGKTEAPWPAQEIWQVLPAERLRQVQIGGASPIDPSRAEVPDEWKTLSAYLMDASSHLTVTETRRGEPDAPPDQLYLSRTFWLDVGGGGYSVRDAFHGPLGGTTRLELRSPGVLGRVSVGGANQLITNATGKTEGGVELRNEALVLEADSRWPRDARLAVGWTTGVQSLQAQLNLPPGWRLLAAPGVDEAEGTWLAEWDLFAVFLVVLIVFLAFRLLGRRWAALVLAMLVLTHGEAGAPQLLWLLVLGVFALRARLSAPRARAAMGAAAVLATVLLALAATAFAVRHVRTALFPQTERPGYGGRGLPDDLLLGGASALRARTMILPEAPAPMAVPPQEQVMEEARKAASEPVAPAGTTGRGDSSIGLSYSFNTLQSNRVASTKTAVTQAYEQDPKAVIQTGAGIPTWSWSSHRLSWSGPVDVSHTMHLVLLSPAVDAVLAVVRVLLVILLLLRLAAEWLRGRLPGRLSWIVAAVAAVAVLGGAPHASAEVPAASPPEVPSTEILDQMRERLMRRPPCEPACVSTAQMHIVASDAELRLEAEVHVAAAAAWAIPGPVDAWVPRSVVVDGQPSTALVHREDGFLHLRLEAGVHRVQVAGPMPAADSVTLQMPQRPRRATVSGEWQADGIHDDGTVDGSIQLSRRVTAPRRAAGAAEGTYEPWLEVTRTFDIGIAWQVTTVVRRVTPPGAPVLAKIPLLKGMLVTDATAQVKDGEVTVSLGRDQLESTWTSTLPPVDGEAIVLEAPTARPWSEVWIVRCGFVWQCDTEGLVPVARRAAGVWAPEFRPWPGERLTLRFSRPTGQAGQSLTIDGATFAVSPGVRLRDVAVDFSARASRLSVLALTLPPKVEMREVKIDGAVKSLRLEGNRLPLSIDAGSHAVHVAWRETEGAGLFIRAPHVELGLPAVNVQATLSVPSDRWLLLVGGAPWGPVVLFWLDLALILAAALGLAGAAPAPLRRAEWLLLAAGLALAGVPAPFLALVALWFVAMAWRSRHDLAPRLHNAALVGLGLWTAVLLCVLTAAAGSGLAGFPEMGVSGELRWYVDRTTGSLPQPWVVSVPLTFYRALMLAWALWLVTAAVRWMKWGLAAVSAPVLWKKSPEAPPASTGVPTEGEPESPSTDG